MADKKPNFQSHRDLPITPVSYWDTVVMVKHALDDLERGQFRMAANLVDAMLRDDRISGVLSTRVNGLLGQPLDMDAGEDAPAPKQALAEDLKQRWPQIFPDADLEDLLRWGIMLGFCPGELLWATNDERWVPKLKVWHPSMAYWDWGPREYRLITMDGTVPLPPTPDGNWLLFTPYGYQRGWMRGAVRALAIPWLIRNWARRDWARQSEVNGNAIKKGIVPISAPKDEREAFVKALSYLGSETAIECPELADGTKFDLQLVEASAQTWEGFYNLLAHADTAIAIVLLGQNLTTEVKQGSRAAAQVHDSVRKDFQQADARKLGRAIEDQVLRPYAAFNNGDEDLAPFPAWETEPPEDESARADTLQKVGSFLTSAKTAAAPVNVRVVLEELGIAVLTEQEEADQKAEAADRAAAAQAAFAAKPKPNVPPGQELPPDGGAPQKLDDRRPAEVLPAGARRGQAYIDALAKRAAVQGASVLQVDLREVHRAIHDATSFQDLRARLVKIVGEQDPATMVDLLEKVQVLAELAGHTAVIEDL